MKAFILGAGQGTRLRPLTDDRPKCLVEVAGQPMLAWQHRSLHAAGIDDVTVVGGYRADAIEAAGYRTLRNEAYATSNMVHSIYLALCDTPPDTDVLIVYGDIAFEPRLVQALLNSEADLVTAIDTAWHAYWRLRFDGTVLEDLESLVLAPDGRIERLGANTRDLAEVDGRYVGLTKVAARAVPALRAAIDGYGVPSALSTTELLQRRIDAGAPVHAALVQRGWFEVDSVADRDLIERLYANHALTPVCDLESLASW